MNVLDGSQLGARGFFQTGLLILCCCSSSAACLVARTDMFGDLGTLLLQAIVVLALGAGGAVACAASRRAVTRTRKAVFAFIALLAFAHAALYARTSYADVSVELASLASSDVDTRETLIAIGPQGIDIRLSGEITEGAAQRLEALLEENPRVRRIHLTSEGGLSDEGQALAKVIAEHGLTTFVPDYCVSACTLAFVGGRDRLVTTNARLGFHAPYAQGLFGQKFRTGTTVERQAYVEAGLTPAFVDRALDVAPADIWIPTAEILREAHVVTDVVDAYRLPDSTLDGDATTAGARASILRGFPLTRAFAEQEPRVLDAMAEWYLDSYRRGRSEGHALDGLKAIVGAAVVLSFTHADDATLASLARYVTRGMRAAMKTAPAVCVDIGEAADLVAAQDALATSASDAPAIEATAVVSRALSDHHPPLDANGVSLIEDATLSSPRSTCRAALAAYEALLRRPAPDVAAEMRALIDRQRRPALTRAIAFAE